MRKSEDQEVQHLTHVFCSPERERRIQEGVITTVIPLVLSPNSRTGGHEFLDCKGQMVNTVGENRTQSRNVTFPEPRESSSHS